VAADRDRAPVNVGVIMSGVVAMTDKASGENTPAACLLRISDLAPGLVPGPNRDLAEAALLPTRALPICVHVYVHVHVRPTEAGITTTGTLAIVCGNSSSLVASPLVLVPVLVEAARLTILGGDLAVLPPCLSLRLPRLALLVNSNSIAVSGNLGNLRLRDQWHLVFKCKAFVVVVEVVVDPVVVAVVCLEGLFLALFPALFPALLLALFLALHLDMHNLCVSDRLQTV